MTQSNNILSTLDYEGVIHAHTAVSSLVVILLSFF